ncbi:MAG TPA: ankyrin repeat domain-containing protein [Candidatus Babeliales bacterium]|nr:ankyrin repeat domain-containing protein [Candidatus Babeliales bacterium]
MKYTDVFLYILFIFFINYMQPSFAMTTKAINKKNNIVLAEQRTTYLTRFLFEACREGYPIEDIARCIAEGINVNVKNDRKVTPLHIACRYGHIHIIKFLLANKANVNAAMDGSFTPLHAAILAPCMILTHKVIIIRYLLNAGANPDAQTTPGDTALNLAYGLNNKAIIELFPNQSSEDSY